jgi:3-hydroxyacyl-CoA dehydrogenase
LKVIIYKLIKAIRWGFGWKYGPFETWQSAGWSFIAEAINTDIKNKNAGLIKR